MICEICNGKGIVPASTHYHAEAWDGIERRQQERPGNNAELKFNEVAPALFQSCPSCEGSGKLHPNLLSKR